MCIVSSFQRFDASSLKSQFNHIDSWKLKWHRFSAHWAKIKCSICSSEFDPPIVSYFTLCCLSHFLLRLVALCRIVSSELAVLSSTLISLHRRWGESFRVYVSFLHPPPPVILPEGEGSFNASFYSVAKLPEAPIPTAVWGRNSQQFIESFAGRVCREFARLRSLPYTITPRS